MAGIAGNQPELGRGKEGTTYPESQRGQGPADTLISEFGPPELCNNCVPNLLVRDGLFQQPQDADTEALLCERKCNTPRSLTGGQPCRKANRRVGPSCSSVSGRGPHATCGKLRALHPQKHLSVATRLVQSLRLTLPKPLEQVPHQGLRSSPCTLQLATGTSPPPKAYCFQTALTSSS